MKRVILLGLPTAALLLLALPAFAGETHESDDPLSLRQGVFSERQVNRGRKVFEKTCQACHPEAWFTESTFLGAWNGRPVHALFSVVRKTMPEDNPGALKRREYAEVLAFIFSINNLPAGEKDMKNDDETLKLIIIETAESGDASGEP